MINILIVDDNNSKMGQICTILNEAGVLNDNIVCTASIIEAKRELSKTKYDVLLLDLILPNHVDTSPEENGGINLLREVLSLETLYKMPRRVFILSEFDEAIQRVNNILHELSFTVIKYDATSDEWRSRLKNYIERIIQMEIEDAKDYDYDAAIICALENPELDEVKHLPFNWSPYNVLGDSTDYFVGAFNGKKLICAASYEMGLSSAAILATKTISTFRPRYLIMTGIAGGVDNNELHFGDVIVADPCFDYESGKKICENGKSVFKPDYRPIRLDNAINQMIRRLAARREKLDAIKETCTYDKPNYPLQVKIGHFGSGASVLSDETVIARVKEHNRKFLGFDMEAYAVMLSGMLSSAPKATSIVMKAVSDFGTGKDDKYQKYAAYTSARVLQCFLEEIWGIQDG